MLSSSLLDQFLCLRNDVVNRKPKFLEDHFVRSRGAVMIKSDHGFGISLPTQRRTGFDGKPGRDVLRKHRVAIVFVLLLEELPTREGDHTHRSSLCKEFLSSFIDETDFRTGSHQDQLWVF